jgi:hypothetical protein
VSSVEALCVRLFSLSLTGTAFAWFSSVPAYSIYGWEPLEQKFHEHFYSGTSEAKLADLTSVRQTHDESVLDYFKRFKETKNRCFNLTISKKDLADLAFHGMRCCLREKLEGHIYLSLAQLQQFASIQENGTKTNKEIVRPSSCEVHVVELSLDSKSSEILTTEFVWSIKTKSLTCDVLIHKNRQDNIKYTFDVAKCDKIFDDLHKGSYIKLSHSLPPHEELKRQAYCKWHNSYSHTTNDSNVFRWSVQSAINEGRLSLKEMKIDRNPFPVNKLDLENPIVLIRPKQADTIVVSLNPPMGIDRQHESWEAQSLYPSAL